MTDNKSRLSVLIPWRRPRARPTLPQLSKRLEQTRGDVRFIVSTLYASIVFPRFEDIASLRISDEERYARLSRNEYRHQIELNYRPKLVFTNAPDLKVWIGRKALKHLLEGSAQLAKPKDLHVYRSEERTTERDRTKIEAIKSTLGLIGYPDRPVILLYYRADNKLWITEGHHRVITSYEAGLDYIPVYVVGSTIPPEARMKYANPPQKPRLDEVFEDDNETLKRDTISLNSFGITAKKVIKNEQGALLIV